MSVLLTEPTTTPLGSLAAIRALAGHAALLRRVTRNELAARYAGSLLGVGWVILAPILVLGIYGLIYLVIFQVRVPNLSPLGYLAYVFAGLVPYLMTAEALSFSVTSVVQNKAALGNSVFPIDLMPPKAVLLAQGTMAIGLIAIVLTGLLAQTLTWTALFVLIVWPLHVLALIGIGWVIAMLNVVFRDLQNLINALLMILLVASPIAYTPEMVPESLKPIILLNPFAYFVTTYQRILVLGEPPTPTKTVILLFGSLAVFWFGSWFFGRSKRILVDYV